jgi:uncharacterized protein (TIGR00730 family)
MFYNKNLKKEFMKETTHLYFNHDSYEPMASEVGVEIIYAKRTLQHIDKAVSIFGGAKAKQDSWEYINAYNLAHELAKRGLSVISGGGPGIMEAANRGTKDAKNEMAKSIGLNINISAEKNDRKYQDISIDFEHFASRKIIFCAHSDAFVVAPGGFGSLDELFEAITLMQTHKLDIVPVILMGEHFWGGLINWINSTMLNSGLVSKEHVGLISIAKDWQDALSILEKEKII